MRVIISERTRSFFDQIVGMITCPNALEQAIVRPPEYDETFTITLKHPATEPVCGCFCVIVANGKEAYMVFSAEAQAGDTVLSFTRQT